MSQQTNPTEAAGRPSEPLRANVPQNPPGFPAGDRGPAPQSVPEQDLWTGRAHWQSSIGRVVLWFIINVALIVGAIYVPRSQWLTQKSVTWIVLAFLLLSTLFMIGGVAIRILQTRYRLTNQRLFIERGILSRTLDQTELIRVDDVRMQQTLVNRIFGIGNVTMLTTDVSDKSVAIIGIKDPVRVTEMIRQQMRTLRGKSVFIETL